ncbi:hypothetical protein M0R45_007205 [Rubus argutus]|uniref:FAD-binding PCMH-type domain-containing protein n=1 Tax=Rubus argutus TaxID=59490 RepID=A0AAW1XXV4_RUBAR
MAISPRNPFAQFFSFMCFLLPSLAEPTDKITSCLTLHNISNFTTYPNTENDSASYYKLLNFSIQNLRFAEPTVPKPIAIILPGSVEQLINTVFCSREVFLAIRVRCGGHSYEGTSSVAADGAPFVIIDMMNLNRVSVDLETETAWVEGGATLGETYHAIAKASRVHGFPAGSCPTVGAGGHIAGGGFGLLSRKYGLAADNVVDALLVDANGRLLDRQGMGEDVFWAIRGGEAKTIGTTGISATFKGFYLGPRSSALSILDHAFPDLGIIKEDCKEMSWIESIVFFSGLSNGSSVSDLRNRIAVEIARDWGEKYFLNNYDRLVKAKTIIDPSNVFSNQQGIPPVSCLSQPNSTAES